MAAQRQAGREIIVVSSGAVGAGMGVLAMDKRPTDLSNLQACAAVGQSRLMSTYTELFARHNLPVAQVLLTHDDLEHRERHLNARNTLRETFIYTVQIYVFPATNQEIIKKHQFRCKQ